MKVKLVRPLMSICSTLLFVSSGVYAAETYQPPKVELSDTTSHGPVRSYLDEEDSTNRTIASKDQRIPDEKNQDIQGPTEVSDEIKEIEDSYFRLPSSEDEDYRPQKRAVKRWKYDFK